ASHPKRWPTRSRSRCSARRKVEEPAMKPKSIAIVGAAETTELGRIPELSQIGLHADPALTAREAAGLGPKDIGGIATAGETPTSIAHYLGLTPKWVDGTAVG